MVANNSLSICAQQNAWDLALVNKKIAFLPDLRSVTWRIRAVSYTLFFKCVIYVYVCVLYVSSVYVRWHAGKLSTKLTKLWATKFLLTPTQPHHFIFSIFCQFLRQNMFMTSISTKISTFAPISQLIIRLSSTFLWMDFCVLNRHCLQWKYFFKIASTKRFCSISPPTGDSTNPSANIDTISTSSKVCANSNSNSSSDVKFASVRSSKTFFSSILF